jgi:hypothetical protein
MRKRLIRLNLPPNPWLPATMSPATISSLRRRISSSGLPTGRCAFATSPRPCLSHLPASREPLGPPALSPRRFPLAGWDQRPEGDRHAPVRHGRREAQHRCRWPARWRPEPQASHLRSPRSPTVSSQENRSSHSPCLSRSSQYSDPSVGPEVQGTPTLSPRVAPINTYLLG